MLMNFIIALKISIIQYCTKLNYLLQIFLFPKPTATKGRKTKYENKAHYNSKREPIHFNVHSLWFHSALLWLVFILLISLLFLLLRIFVCPSDWVCQSKRRILISLFHLVPHPDSAPPSAACGVPIPIFIEIRIKRVLKPRRSLIVNFLAHFQSWTRLATFFWAFFSSLPWYYKLIKKNCFVFKLATNLRVIAASCTFYDFCSAFSRFVLMNHGYVGYNLVLIALWWHLCCQRHTILLMFKWAPIHDIIIKRYLSF